MVSGELMRRWRRWGCSRKKGEVSLDVVVKKWACALTHTPSSRSNFSADGKKQGACSVSPLVTCLKISVIQCGCSVAGPSPYKASRAQRQPRFVPVMPQPTVRA